MNRSQFLRRMFGGTIAAGALAVTAVPAFAQSGKEKPEHAAQHAAEHAEGNHGAAARAKRHGAAGTIKSVDAGAKSFVLTTKQGDLTVTTNAETRFHVPGVENATFASLAKDLRVAVRGDRPSETTLLAARVNAQKAKEAKEHGEGKKDHEAAGRTVTVGVVSDLASDGSSFKLTPSGGAAMTFKVTADTEKTLIGTASFANGVTARVVSSKDAAGNNVALRIRVPA